MRILGIEFGSWSLKATEIETRFRKVDILDFHEVRLPLEISDPTQTYKSAVSELMNRLPSVPEKIVVSLPAAQTALRFLPIPIKQRKKVEKMFRFELEDNVPFNLDNAIVEHFYMSKGDGSVIFAAIAPNHHVKSHVEWLSSVGIDPDWLTFEGMGLINLYLAQAAQPKKAPPKHDGPVLLLDIGHHKTNLSIYEENRLELFRSISWGGAEITQAIARGLSVNREEAEKHKIKNLRLDVPVEEANDELKEMILSTSQSFTPFLADLNHSLVSFRTLYGKKIDNVLLTGGTSNVRGIKGFLERSLGTSVDTFHPFEGFSVKETGLSADESRFGETLGRALVFTRKFPILFNFRQQSQSKGSSVAELSQFLSSPSAIKGLAYAGVLALGLFVHVHLATFLNHSKIEKIESLVNRTFMQTFPGTPAKVAKNLIQDTDALKKFIENKNRELEQKYKVLKDEKPPKLNFVLAISNAFPKSLSVDVNKLNIEENSFSVEGVLYQGDINQAVDLIKKNKLFNGVTVSNKDNRFTISGNITGT